MISIVSGPYFSRLDKNNIVLLVVDRGLGKLSVLVHAALGKLFNLPTILTSSAKSGPDGTLYKEILEMQPTAPLIYRQGEVDSWNNADFLTAVKATGKTQAILAGIVTEVWANIDISGTFNDKLAGIHLISMFGTVMVLIKDWHSTPGIVPVLRFMDTCFTPYSLVARSRKASTFNGTIVPGKEDL
ncbi:hypothetical protein BJ878DRAFT_582036 [Calycina marina]|uniref:Uncharacterized protein n=1 Tax=Calycina marina TaxID=1763456 RepID=A0A9P8CFP0_9HELO|nr:hypothetical protein BJ878DRAFT_582036 [Calycina marina]